MAEKSHAKQRGRPFRPGVSGNPAGRPKGSGLAGTLRRAIAADAEAVVRSLIEKATAGDVAAARVLLDRVCAPLKAEAAPTEGLPALAGGSLAERATGVMDAVARGELGTDRAADLLAALAQAARIIEVDELARRVAALEAR